MQKGETLSKEQVLAIPEALKILTCQQIADSPEYNCKVETIRRWARKLRKIGYEVNMKRGRRTVLPTIKY